MRHTARGFASVFRSGSRPIEILMAVKGVSTSICGAIDLSLASREMIIGYPDSPTLVINNARRAAGAHAFVATPRICPRKSQIYP
jgi:hypothetical protein